jgi:hypothetical protein
MRTTTAAAAAVLVAALVATGVDAAITWQSASTLTTSVISSPVTFAAGTAASNTRYFSSFALSTNATSFAVTIAERAGGDVNVKDVVQLVSQSGSALPLTLSAGQVSNANILAFTWTVKNGTSTVATLDMQAASPSAAFTLPAGLTYKLDLRLKLIPGAGGNNGTFSTTMGVAAS